MNLIRIEQMNHQRLDDVAGHVLPHTLAAADAERVEIVSELRRKRGRDVSMGFSKRKVAGLCTYVRELDVLKSGWVEGGAVGTPERVADVDRKHVHQDLGLEPVDLLSSALPQSGPLFGLINRAYSHLVGRERRGSP